MTTQEQLEEAIKLLWVTGWEAAHGPLTAEPVPYALENEAKDAASVFVELTIVPTVRLRATQGRSGAKYDARGLVMVQVFGPVDDGGARVARLCDDVIAALEERRIGGLVLHEGSARPAALDPDDEARWYARIVSVPYVLEQQR